MIGIYKIISPSGKIYIGQSWEIETRLRAHRNEVNYSRSIRKHLYNSLRKYGWEAHIIEILQQFPEDITQEVLNSYEKFYIEQFKEVGFVLFNIKEGGTRGKHTTETKQLMSNIKLGKKKSPEMRAKMVALKKGKSLSAATRIAQIKALSKPILQFDLEGNFLEEWESAACAARFYNILAASIGQACRGKIPKTNGFIWKFKNQTK